MPEENGHHVHKYQRFVVGKKKHMIFKCMIPGCSHFQPTKELIIGAQSRCWGGALELECQNIILMNQSHILPSITGAKPFCEDCKELRKKKKETRKEWARLMQSQLSQ